MLAMVLFLIVGCFLAIFLGRLGDFIDYYLYVDKKTGLPNRERCDDRIEHYGEGKLQDRFSFISLTLELSELDRNDGDWALQIVGEALQRVFRSIAFVGYNGAGQFMIMMENSTEDFTARCIERFLQVLKRSELPGWRRMCMWAWRTPRRTMCTRFVRCFVWLCAGVRRLMSRTA